MIHRPLTLACRRNDRLKSIKELAEKDLDEFRVQQKRRFEEQVRAKTAELNKGDSATSSNVIDKEVAQLHQDFKVNKEEVLNMLFANIMNVNIEIPRVVKGDFDNQQI